MAERKRRKQTRKDAQKRTLAGVAILLVCSLAVIFAVQIMILRTIGSYDQDIIIDGVSIGETDVSGMTAEKAKSAVESAAQAYAGVELVLSLDDGRQGTVTLGDLGLSVKDLDSIVQEAADYGKKGNSVENYKILKSSEAGTNSKVFQIEYQVTEKSAEDGLNACLGSQLKKPVNARLTQAEGKTQLIEDEPGEVLDLKKTVASINELIGGDWDKKGGTVKAEVSYEDAQIVSEDLSGITDVLGSYSTYYGDGDEGRTMNVESGAQHVGGTLVQPGEEVSVNALMEPYTEENGYAMAASFENGEVVDSMGGGICQVSTTLYNALLLSEVEITERYAHSMLVSYVEPSMDAAIADDVKDLKFRNNKEDPIYIESVLSDGNVGFNIYGKETRPENRSIEFESETIETTESDEIRYVATDDYIGAMYTSSSAQEGLTAQLWKIVYEDGEEVSRDTVNYSQYNGSAETISVGTASDNEEDTEKMNAAIETQDEDQILAAIEEITEGSSEE